MSRLHTLSVHGLAAVALLVASVYAHSPARADQAADQAMGPDLGADPIALAAPDLASTLPLAPMSRKSAVNRRKRPYSSYLSTYLAIIGTSGLLVAAPLFARSDGPAPLILAYSGILIGPSLGHFYTRDWARAFLPIGLRVSGLALIVAGGVGLSDFCFDFCPPKTWQKLAPVALIVGVTSLLGGGIYSFFDAGRSAHRQNRKQHLLLAPAPIMNTSGGRGVGLSLSGRF